jgi:hypothetical protein
MTMTLYQCTKRFLQSRDQFMAQATLWIVTMRLLLPFTELDFYLMLLGVGLYYMFESFAHWEMHYNPLSLFRESHRLHHEEPTPENGTPYLWVPMVLLGVGGVLFKLGHAHTLTIMSSVLVCVLAYEYVHFLCHCPYVPKTAWGRRVRINHLQHHGIPHTRFDMLFVRRK